MKKVDSFNKSINNINPISRFYEDEFKRLKKNYNKFKNIHNILSTIDSLINGSTSTSISLSIMGFC